MNDSVLLSRAEGSPARRLVQINLDGFDLNKHSQQRPENAQKCPSNGVEFCGLGRVETPSQCVQTIQKLQEELAAVRLTSAGKIEYLENLVMRLQWDNAELTAALQHALRRAEVM